MFILMSLLTIATVCTPVQETPSVIKERQTKKVFVTKDGKTITYKKVPTKWVKTPKKSI